MDSIFKKQISQDTINREPNREDIKTRVGRLIEQLLVLRRDIYYVISARPIPKETVKLAIDKTLERLQALEVQLPRELHYPYVGKPDLLNLQLDNLSYVVSLLRQHFLESNYPVEHQAPLPEMLWSIAPDSEHFHNMDDIFLAELNLRLSFNEFICEMVAHSTSQEELGKFIGYDQTNQSEAISTNYGPTELGTLLAEEFLEKISGFLRENGQGPLTRLEFNKALLETAIGHYQTDFVFQLLKVKFSPIIAGSFSEEIDSQLKTLGFQSNENLTLLEKFRILLSFLEHQNLSTKGVYPAGGSMEGQAFLAADVYKGNGTILYSSMSRFYFAHLGIVTHLISLATALTVFVSASTQGPNPWNMGGLAALLSTSILSASNLIKSANSAAWERYDLSLKRNPIGLTRVLIHEVIHFFQHHSKRNS